MGFSEALPQGWGWLPPSLGQRTQKCCKSRTCQKTHTTIMRERERERERERDHRVKLIHFRHRRTVAW